jgi:hypothetical protein
VNAIQKPLSSLKKVLQKPRKTFQGFWYWIYRASSKTWCEHIAQFCYPLQTNWNMKSKEHLCKNNAYSQCGVTWQTDATDLWKCDLGLPSHLLHRGS